MFGHGRLWPIIQPILANRGLDRFWPILVFECLCCCFVVVLLCFVLLCLCCCAGRDKTKKVSRPKAGDVFTRTQFVPAFCVSTGLHVEQAC